jgi:hypothetical protein
MNSGPVTSALMMACHVGGGMAEPVLDMRFIDVGRGGEASEQAEPAEERGAIPLGQIRANAHLQVRLLHGPHGMLVVKPFGADTAVLRGDPAEDRAMDDARVSTRF